MLKLPQNRGRKQELEQATIRDFSGGYNVLDSEFNLASKYSVKSFNIFHTASNTKRIRQGTALFSTLTAVCASPTSYPINIEYFGAAIIAVMSSGEVVSVLADRTTTLIWNNAKAALLPGAPAGWSATTFASFEQFNGELIICNGVDKPLIVSADLTVDYLQDLGTLSNLNTPICKYVTACSRFLVMAGDPVHPNRIHISSRDTSGTWYGDVAPNDGIYIDVGSSLNNASVIKGIRAFRGSLIVAFEEGTIIGQLGIYTGADHTPNFDETIQQYGAISHRTLVDLGDDMLMLDNVGVPSLKRTVFTGTIRPDRFSDLVDPDMTPRLAALDTASLEDRCFAVYDRLEGQFIFFIPNASTIGATTETVGFALLYRPTLSNNSWCRFDGMNFTCGCRTVQGNLFFGSADGKLWRYGTTVDPLYADLTNDPSINGGAGNPISFTWELPWSDINVRAKIKKTKYISMDTQGTGNFTVNMYVDRIMLNDALEDTPLLSTEFVGGDVDGYGGPDGSFGGARITADEHLYQWPAKFKLMKLKITGEVTTALEFSSITLHYQKGGIAR